MLFLVCCERRGDSLLADQPPRAIRSVFGCLPPLRFVSALYSLSLYNRSLSLSKALKQTPMAGRRKRVQRTHAETTEGGGANADEGTDRLETPDASVYEESRDLRIKQNKEKMQKLGILDLSLKLKSKTSLPKRSSDKKSQIVLLPGSPRRSSRYVKALSFPLLCLFSGKMTERRRRMCSRLKP